MTSWSTHSILSPPGLIDFSDLLVKKVVELILFSKDTDNADSSVHHFDSPDNSLLTQRRSPRRVNDILNCRSGCCHNTWHVSTGGLVNDKTVVDDINKNTVCNNSLFGNFCLLGHGVQEIFSSFLPLKRFLLNPAVNISCFIFVIDSVSLILFLKLHICTKRRLNMGARCSSKFHDGRPWSMEKNAEGFDISKDRKNGYFLKKRTQSDPACDKTYQLSPVCACQQQEHNSSEEQHSPNSKTSKAKAPKLASDCGSSLTRLDVSAPASSPLSNNRLSPNVTGSGRMKLFSVMGSGKSRATANCDVSPHRLLTRRSYSPKSRAVSLDFRTASLLAERQRSQSWSNGRLGTKETFRAMSPTFRDSYACPARNSRPRLSQGPSIKANISPVFSTSPPNSSSKSAKVKVHDFECPLHVKSNDVPKISISAEPKVLDDFDSEWSPIARRRAASESQTTRPRRLLPRTPDSADLVHSHEHVHVHWADEESGSSLSSSVFLSNVRPRSWSQGAIGSAPHRPILKKVPEV